MANTSLPMFLQLNLSLYYVVVCNYEFSKEADVVECVVTDNG